LACVGPKEVVERACQVRPHSDYACPTGSSKQGGPPLAPRGIRVALDRKLGPAASALGKYE